MSHRGAGDDGAALEVEGYRTLDVIHRGRGRTVARARRLSDDRPVVLKVLVDDYPRLSDLARLRAEFDLLRHAAGEGIVAAYELKKRGHGLALVLEDIGGESLGAAIGRGMGLDRFFEVATATARALGVLHARGVVHRDVNPSNVLYNARTGELRLIDLDLSSRLAREDEQVVSPDRLAGTLAYISPEQTGRMNRGVDLRSDLYSLGVTFYELLTGELPFVTVDPMELVHCHIAHVAPRVRAARADAPECLSAVVARLLAKVPEERYRGTAGLVADLEECRRRYAEGEATPFVTGLHDRSDRFQIPERLYGREAELGVALSAFDRAAAGTTQVLLIEGYAGIGKSSLVNEIHKPVAARRGYFVSGKFDQLERGVPFAAVLGALSELVRQVLTESDEQLAAWHERLREGLGATARVLVDVIPELALIVRDAAPVPELPPGAAQIRFHAAFQNLVSVFATTEHPLVLFLDDLQWADAASLELIDRLALRSEARGLLLLCAFRDEAVGPSHPFAALRDRLAALPSCTTLALGPLPLAELVRMLEDALPDRLGDAAALAALVHEKTGGNPFFVSAFLRALHEDGHVTFDRAREAWTWDIAGIRAAGITDNVVELTAARLRSLPDGARGVVELASCIGAEFELAPLALARGAPVARTIADLWGALEAGVVVPIGSGYREVMGALDGDLPQAEEPAGRARFRFLHDRVQQAAYSLLPAPERPAAHLRIGRILLGAARAAGEEPGFDVADQLGRGRGLITSPVERRELASIDLRCARRAKASTAFGPASAYASAGVELLGDAPSLADRELWFALHVEAAECAYLAGSYAQMDALVAAALARRPDVLVEVELREIEIKASMARNQMRRAVDIAIAALPLVGVHIAARGMKAQTAVALVHARVLVGRRTPADLARLPEMTDPAQLAAMRLLTAAAQPAYYAAPDALPVLLLRMVALVMRGGNSPLSPYAWVAYGHIQNLVFGDARSALAFGRLGLDLLARYRVAQYQSKIEFLFAAFVMHWTTHWRDTLEPLRAAYRIGVDTGDTEYAATSIHIYCYHLFCVGAELDTVEAEQARYAGAIRQTQQARTVKNASLRRQVVRNLRGRAGEAGASAAPWLLDSDSYDEAGSLAQLRSSHDRTGLCQYHLFKALLCFLFERRDDALSHIEAADGCRDGLVGLVLLPVFRFYQALVLLDACDGPARARHLRVAGSARAALDGWSRFAPMNHLHRVLLVDAERARVEGRATDAMALYDQAIEAARKGEFLHEEALAAELAGRFHAGGGRARIARGYLLDARHAYSRWGAGAKVAQLDARWPELLAAAPARGASAEPERATRTSGAGEAGEAGEARSLDLSTVMKGTQAISSEIVLDRLLDRLMSIVMENAGARRGVLLLDDAGRLSVVAAGAIVEGGGYRAVGTDDERGRGMAMSIARYVERTLEPVVLDDAAGHARFASDPWLRERRPRSVLCAPLVAQGRVIGVVYLENDLAPGAFTPARVEVARVLAAQAAISIDNARLYAQQKEALEAQTRLSEAALRFVPREFLQSLNRQSLVDVALGENVRKEMSVLFSDIRGFTTLVEGMSPGEHIGFINTYLSHMEPAILAQGGFVDSYIGDAIMALFEGDADRALSAGVGMGRGLAALNASRAREGLAPIRMGIGVNTGPLTLGTIGGPMRLKCGVIGDSVNLAARVESLTKTYGATLLATHHTVDRLRDPGTFSLRVVDRVAVKGKTEPVTLYEVLDAEDAAARDAKLSTLSRFSEASERYHGRAFGDAARLFEECLTAHPADLAARSYLDRARRYAEVGVPEGWDGVEVLTHK